MRSRRRLNKYPFQPDILDALPEELAELYRNLEMTLLEEICSRLNLAGELNEVTVESVRALRSHGISLEEIEKAIRDTTGISEKKLNELLDDVVERNQAYYTELIDLAGVTKPQILVSAATIDAIYRQTGRELLNLTQSMGFLVDGGRTMLPPAKAYQWALNNAEMQVQSGAISYNQAIKRAIMQLADSGIRVVNYESGHRDHIDVAARRAVMTGVSQLCAKYTEQSAEYLNTPYFEVSAHIGARDKGKGWANHREWQGKVYSTRDHDKYPNIYDVCGLGRVDGLEGANCRHIRTAFVDGVMERTYTDKQLSHIDDANCRHIRTAFVDGVMERTYTDKQLSHIDDGRDADFEGRHYSAYEATQKQRQIERTVRKLERRRTAFAAQGNTEEAQAAQIKIRRLRKEYKAFSTAADLPLQTERMKVIR